MCIYTCIIFSVLGLELTKLLFVNQAYVSWKLLLTEYHGYLMGDVTPDVSDIKSLSIGMLTECRFSNHSNELRPISPNRHGDRQGRWFPTVIA